MSTRQNILVTGASRGLGLAIVRLLLTQGLNVIALSRQSSPELTSLIDSLPDSVRHVEFDLLNSKRLTADWFQQDVCQALPLHGLVNNAAIAYDDLITNTPADGMIEMRILYPLCR